jgi:chemotaxis protein MotB
MLGQDRPSATRSREAEMAGFTRFTVAAGVFGALIATTQGCVSYDMYDRKCKEVEGFKAAYQGADDVVANRQKEIDALKSKIAGMERELASANQRASNASTVVEAKFEDMKRKYERMIEELRAEESGDFQINQSTGGVVLDDNVFFSPGKAELKSEKFPTLDALIGKLQKGDLATATIEIAGHTDADPIARSGWKDNFQLSSERARAVLVYFQKKGIDTTRLFLSGYGSTRPRGNKKNEDRRVEIVLHERDK